MKHAVGRRSGRRRAIVAVITTAMTIATVLAITAPARSAGRAATPGRVQAGRQRRDVRRPRPRWRRRRAQRPGRAGPLRARAPAGHAGRGAVGSDDRHAQDGRASGRLPHRAERAARPDRRDGLRPREPDGVRPDERRHQDVPPAAGLRGHRGRASPLVDAIEARHPGLPQRPPRERHRRRPSGQRDRVAGARHPRRLHGAAHQLRRGDRRRARGRRRSRRRRAGLRLGVARPVPDGTRRPARVEDVHVAEHAAAQPVGRGRDHGSGAVPTEPVERRDRDRDRVGVLPERSGAGGRPTRPTPSRSRSTTARVCSVPTRTSGPT